MNAVRRAGWIGIAVLGLATGLGWAGQCGAQTPVSLDMPPATAAVLAARAPASVAELKLIQKQLLDVLAKALPATTDVEVGRASGSGVIVSPDGIVLTAAHVIGRPGRRAWVELSDGRRLRATTLGADHDADAGMLKIDAPPTDLPYVSVYEGPPLEPGAWVVTTGQPGGLIEGRSPPVRLGRVLFRDDDLLCTDCKLVGGDSGGPLFNMQGQVVGIHSSIGPMITHNFHVPITAFHNDWKRLTSSELWGGDYDEKNSDRAVLGVTGESVGGKCVLTIVTENMAAAKAGVKVGDVVLAVNGREISTFEQLKKTISLKAPGDRVALRIDRHGEIVELRMQLTRPDGTVPRPQRPAPEKPEKE